MKLGSKVLASIVGAIVGIYGAGFFLNDEVLVKQDIKIDAPREQVFQMVSDFSAWNIWSPWVQMDPAAIYAVTGEGAGHRMVWNSEHPAIGEGTQTIIHFEPPRMIETRLDLGGWGDGYGAFVFLEEEGGTRILWEYNGRMREGKPFLLKPIHTYYGIFMDEMLDPTYVRGLEQLKAAAEALNEPQLAEAAMPENINSQQQ